MSIFGKQACRVVTYFCKNPSRISGSCVQGLADAIRRDVPPHSSCATARRKLYGLPPVRRSVGAARIPISRRDPSRWTGRARPRRHRRATGAKPRPPLHRELVPPTRVPSSPPRHPRRDSGVLCAAPADQSGTAAFPQFRTQTGASLHWRSTMAISRTVIVLVRLESEKRGIIPG